MVLWDGMIDCKLICSDVDRTLVTQDLKLPDENRKWVRKVVEEKHIPFAIVSGRFRGSVEPVIKELGVSAIKCCFNGNFIQMGEEVLYDKPMDTDVVRKMLRYTRKAGMTTLIFDLDDWFMESDDAYWYNHQLRMSGKKGTLCNFDTLLDKWEKEGHPFYKMIPRSLDTDAVHTMVSTLQDAVGDQADIFLSSPYIVETAPKGTDKANVIPILAKRLGIRTDQVMAFGDYDNDLGMLKASGFPIAVANAQEELKRIASYVTASCDEAGVAQAIKKYFFEA